MLAAHPVGRLRRPAEKDVGAGLLNGLDFGIEVLDAVIGTAMVEGRRRGPGLHQHVQVVVGPGVALVLVQVVAVTPLLGVAATGDDVHGDATS